MNKRILIIALSLVASLTLVECSTPAEKVEKAQQDVMDANKNLDKANEDYLQEIARFKKGSAERIAINNQKIAEYKAKLDHEKNTKSDNYKRLADLEKKNADMQKKMEDYKANGKDNWTQFKLEFSKEMLGLNKDLGDSTTIDTLATPY